MPSLENTLRLERSTERGADTVRDAEGEVKEVLDRLGAKFTSARAGRHTVANASTGPLNRASALMG